MRWPWRRHPGGEPVVGDDVEQAHEQMVQAQRLLARAHRRRPEVERLADDLRATRARNHFAEAVAEVLRGGRG